MGTYVRWNTTNRPAISRMIFPRKAKRRGRRTPMPPSETSLRSSSTPTPPVLTLRRPIPKPSLETLLRSSPPTSRHCPPRSVLTGIPGCRRQGALPARDGDLQGRVELKTDWVYHFVILYVTTQIGCECLCQMNQCFKCHK